MWQLILKDLHYKRGLLALVYCLAAAVWGVILAVSSRNEALPPADRFSGFVLFATCLGIPYLVSVISLMATHRREHRIRLQMALPLSVKTVGLARFLTPILLGIPNLLLGGAMLAVTSLINPGWLSLESALLANGTLLFGVQLVLFGIELDRSPWAQTAFFVAIVISTLPFIVGPDRSDDLMLAIIRSPVFPTATHLGIAVLLSLSLHLFARRTHWLD